MGTSLNKGAGITSLVGTGIQAGGAYEAGQATKKAENFNAQIARDNAAIALQNAAWTGAEGNSQVESQELKNRTQMGNIEANQAASGVDVNKGSAVNVRATQEAMGQLDVATVRANAARRAYGFETEASGFQSQAELDATAAKQAGTAGLISATGTILSGTSTAAQKYAGYLASNSGATAPGLLNPNLANAESPS